MTDLFYEVMLDNQDRAYQVIIHGEEGGRRVTIGKGNPQDMTLGRSALSAATSFFKFQSWDELDSNVGIHISQPLKNTDALQRTIGYVHYDYVGNEYPQVDISDYPLGWAPLVERMGRVSIGSFVDQQHATNVANKHDMIDAYMMGYTVKIMTLPYHDLVEHYIGIWTELDIAKAEKKSRQAIGMALQNDRVIGTAIRKAKAEAERPPPTPRPPKPKPQDPVGPSVKIRVFEQKNQCDMATLPSGMYSVIDHKGRPASEVTLSWDPTKIYEQSKWRNIASAKWQLILDEA